MNKSIIDMKQRAEKFFCLKKVWFRETVIKKLKIKIAITPLNASITSVHCILKAILFWQLYTSILQNQKFQSISQSVEKSQS